MGRQGTRKVAVEPLTISKHQHLAVPLKSDLICLIICFGHLTMDFLSIKPGIERTVRFSRTMAKSLSDPLMVYPETTLRRRNADRFRKVVGAQNIVKLSIRIKEVSSELGGYSDANLCSTRFRCSQPTRSCHRPGCDRKRLSLPLRIGQ
jgi:hypothetical protein